MSLAEYTPSASRLVKSSRAADFVRVVDSLRGGTTFSGKNALVAEGDSLSLLQKMPDHSVSLILTDPPYHSTKKRNIYGDTAFDHDDDYVSWIKKYAAEWKRVLKPNGSLYLFCASEMAARIEVAFSKPFNVLSHIVWTKPNEPGFDGWKQKMKKEALRQWYSHSERILFVEPAFEGNMYRSYFANFLRAMREQAGLSQHELTGMTGAYGKVNHGGAVSNWEAGRNTPSREQYEKICDVLCGTGRVKSMPPYDDVIRPFEMDAAKEFTDIWTFPNVRPYKGKHPAEKPLALLEHAIAAASCPGDIVLDCFAGSGSTAIAALRLGRRAISIEIERRLVEGIVSKMEFFDSKQGKVLRKGEAPSPRPADAKGTAQLPF
jgi:adenine-specific DNA-methyltransferase